MGYGARAARSRGGWGFDTPAPPVDHSSTQLHIPGLRPDHNKDRRPYLRISHSPCVRVRCCACACAYPVCRITYRPTITCGVARGSLSLYSESGASPACGLELASHKRPNEPQPALLATRPLRGTLACSRCCGYSSAIAFSYSARSASGCGKRCGGWPCPWRCPESLTPRSLSLIFKARSCVRARVLPRSGVLPRVSPHSHTPQPDQASAVCPPAALGSASGHQPPLRPPENQNHTNQW